MEDRLAQIKEMEGILDRTNDLIQETEKLLENWTKNLPEFKRLMAYYQSQQWMEDHEAYTAGEIPQNFPCGVLGEDSVYNAFGEHRDLALSMIKLGVKALEE